MGNFYLIISGKALLWSNAHFGNPMQLLQMERSLGYSSFINIRMFDGWETARNPNRPSEYLVDAIGNLIIPGNEWGMILK
jgi:allantoicase